MDAHTVAIYERGIPLVMNHVRMILSTPHQPPSTCHVSLRLDAFSKDSEVSAPCRTWAGGRREGRSSGNKRLLWKSRDNHTCSKRGE